MSNTNTMVNGDVPHSVTLRHLLSYPAVQDGVRKFKTNPVGKMSIQLSNTAYQMIAAPLLPLLSLPYQYVSPYIMRADQLADRMLSMVEQRFPAVKKPAPELLNEAKKAAYMPVQMGQSGAQYVADVYHAKCQKTSGEDAVAHGKAAVKTAVELAAQALDLVTQATKRARDFVDHIDEVQDKVKHEGSIASQRLRANEK
ncbi:hypothetical protein VTK56DRAFT_9899 [Thermocarpiscus australiensis]